MRSRLLAVMAALSSLAVAACSSGSAGPDFVRVSGRLPEISGTTLDGHPFGPADYLGRIVVVNFWNQDCPPCLEEAPVLEEAYAELGPNGVAFLGVVFVGQGWPDDPAAARAFLEDHGITYPSILDRSSMWAEALSVVGIPTTVVADRAGELRFKLLGKVRPGQLERVVQQLEEG